MSDANLIMKTLLEIQESIGGLRSDVQAAVKSLDAHIADDKSYQEDTDERLTELEQGEWKRRGMAAAAGFIGSVITGIGGYIIGRN